MDDQKIVTLEEILQDNELEKTIIKTLSDTAIFDKEENVRASAINSLEKYLIRYRLSLISGYVENNNIYLEANFEHPELKNGLKKFKINISLAPEHYLDQPIDPIPFPYKKTEYSDEIIKESI